MTLHLWSLGMKKKSATFLHFYSFWTGQSFKQGKLFSVGVGKEKGCFQTAKMHKQQALNDNDEYIWLNAEYWQMISSDIGPDFIGPYNFLPYNF